MVVLYVYNNNHNNVTLTSTSTKLCVNNKLFGFFLSLHILLGFSGRHFISKNLFDFTSRTVGTKPNHPSYPETVVF